MDYWQVMNLPIRTFWLMSGCIPRCLAEQDLRAIAVHSNIQDSKEVKRVRDSLIIELEGKEEGDKSHLAIDKTRDEEGVAYLKSII